MSSRGVVYELTEIFESLAVVQKSTDSCLSNNSCFSTVTFCAGTAFGRRFGVYGSGLKVYYDDDNDDDE